MSGPIPTSPEFPVVWERLEDESLFWNQDRMHFPEPSPPMQQAFIECFNEGITRAAAFYGLPITLRYVRMNTYYFNTTVPTVAPEYFEEAGQKAAAKIGQSLGRLGTWWDEELLPEVKDHLRWWEEFDLEDASMPELVRHLDETRSRLSRLWEIHFLIGFPFMTGPSIFADFYDDLFAGKGSLGAYKLLQGFGNRTVDGGHALWALSRKALTHDAVRSAIESAPPSGVPEALGTFDAGRALLGELEEYLEEFGQRSDRFADVSSPGWIENPVTAIQNMKNFMTEPDRDMPAELQTLASEREELIAEAREALQGYPEAVRGQFEFLLKAAQEATVIQEDHNYWIDQRSSWKVRVVLLEFGRRFAMAGIIDDPEDVFMLTLDELLEDAGSLSEDRRATVKERRAEMEHFAKIRAPEAIGTPPTEPMPENPLTKAFGRFGGTPVQQPEKAGLLNGHPCSPGKATGTVKVVMSLAEADKLEPGDILVAPATMPAWTPLFASIAAVVTDAGGVLSHAAIVAREYNIPAVLGTGRGTAVLKDGQQVEVDGDAGVVRVIS